MSDPTTPPTSRRRRASVAAVARLSNVLPAARRVAHVLTRPIERFLAIEASSGIVLIIVAAVALAWANSPWSASYVDTWGAHLGFSLDGHPVTTRVLVDDVLMSVFFLLVGLEIRRELHAGELSDPRRAALPAIAALGGMLAPAAIYVIFAGGGAAAKGWGVPMATDIAFAVGVLALLGSRVPPALRVLLLALAIIDDLGAILVIAIFYAGSADASGYVIAGGALAGFAVLLALRVRAIPLYLVVGAALWLGVFRAGVHPTIAGVVTGLLIPTQAAGREERSPGARLEHVLHPWVAYAIMPVFALANAGVDLGGVDLGASAGAAPGIMIGLVAGKLIGVVLACAIAVRLGVAALPSGVRWSAIVVLGAVAGIGFTMALFIAQLAFAGHPELHAAAKASVLIASVIAAVGALVLGRVLLRRDEAADAASAHEAESSTDL